MNLHLHIANVNITVKDEKQHLELKELLHSIIKKSNKMSEQLDQINQSLSDINEATNNIAADLERLAGQIQTGGLTAEETTSVVTQLQAAADRLKAVAAVNPEPPAGEPETV